MTVDEIWRSKSEEQLLAAFHALPEFTEAGRVAILTELRRRQDAGVLTGSVVEDDTPDGGHRLDTGEDTGSLLIRLWRGQVPLARTYWVFGFAINLLLRALIVLALAVRPLLVLLLAVYLAYLGFIYVAIWRSAGRYAGDAFWRNLARLSIVLIILGGIANLFLHP